MPVQPGRFAATLEGDFVLFLIGMRINKPLLVHKWLPVARAMPRMLQELSAQPELGLLHAQASISGLTISTTQYWRSFDHLHAYAHAKDGVHLPAWAAFNRAIGNNGAVGIYHESYLVRAGEYESVYANMPRSGLARAGQWHPATGRMQSARSRLNKNP